MKNEIIIQKILSYTEGMTYKDFICNDLVIEACVFNLSQIGELSNKLDNGFQERNSAISWKQLYGLRNRIVHDYKGVNLKLVWEIISEDIPELKENLKSML